MGFSLTASYTSNGIYYYTFSASGTCWAKCISAGDAGGGDGRTPANGAYGGNFSGQQFAVYNGTEITINVGSGGQNDGEGNLTPGGDSSVLIGDTIKCQAPGPTTDDGFVGSVQYQGGQGGICQAYGGGAGGTAGSGGDGGDGANDPSDGSNAPGGSGGQDDGDGVSYGGNGGSGCANDGTPNDMTAPGGSGGGGDSIEDAGQNGLDGAVFIFFEASSNISQCSMMITT